MMPSLLLLYTLLYIISITVNSVISISINESTTLNKEDWRNMHFIGAGCIKNSDKSDRIKVQKNLDILASLWKHAHFVIYADAVSKEAWHSEVLTSGKARGSYHFLLDDFQNADRIHRLINGRNTLLKKARQITLRRHYHINNTIVAMIDLDDMNTPYWKVDTIIHSMGRINDWDVVSYNRPYYYDIWALRYPAYNINCWGPGVDTYRVIHAMRSDIQQRLSKEALVEVYSAFNGLAFYKAQFLFQCQYVWTPNEIDHKDLHLCIRNQGGRVRVFNETIMDEHFKGPHRRRARA